MGNNCPHFLWVNCSAEKVSQCLRYVVRCIEQVMVPQTVVFVVLVVLAILLLVVVVPASVVVVVALYYLFVMEVLVLSAFVCVVRVWHYG